MQLDPVISKLNSLLDPFLFTPALKTKCGNSLYVPRFCEPKTEILSAPKVIRFISDWLEDCDEDSALLFSSPDTGEPLFYALFDPQTIAPNGSGSDVGFVDVAGSKSFSWENFTHEYSWENGFIACSHAALGNQAGTLLALANAQEVPVVALSA